MADENGIVQTDESFVDESGWTSMEPEGAGHHPHLWSDFPDIASEERWEDDFGGEPGGDGGEANPRGQEGVQDKGVRRGPEPVEGDGWGAPE